MKKIIAALLGAVMITGTTAALVGCGEEDEGKNAKYRYNITVWVGEDTKTLTQKLITDFNKSNGQSIWFYAKVNEVTESKAAGDVTNKPEDAPEIFCFAQDQIARLVNSRLLAPPAQSVVDSLTEINTATAMNAATVGSTVYAYPLTEDNGYFLYYDKRVISDEQAGSVEGILDACSEYESSHPGEKRYFSFDLKGGWYVSSFFYGAGAKSDWAVTDQGKFTTLPGENDTFNSDKGLIAAQGLQKVLKHKSYLDDDTKDTGKASDFNAASPAAAVVSGIWDYKAAKNALGNNLGVAKLPTYTVDETEHQLKSFLGCKLLGVSPQEGDANKAAALTLLAQYLTNEDSQMARYNSFGWGPSTKSGQNNATVKADVALSALKETATVPQGQYPADWWNKVKVLSGSVKDAATGDLQALQKALSDYADGLRSLLDK
ncbi:MAG: extracellular solute-binding protein [Clostridiales bacterium]|nr:extracellular solute-binding protein [Clostridiales bacterium]